MTTNRDRQNFQEKAPISSAINPVDSVNPNRLYFYWKYHQKSSVQVIRRNFNTIADSIDTDIIISFLQANTDANGRINQSNKINDLYRIDIINKITHEE